MAFKRIGAKALLRKNNKQGKKNWFLFEVKNDIANMSKTQLKQAIMTLAHAYKEAEILKWDCARFETKKKIIQYLLSRLNNSENHDLARKLDNSPDIYVCLAWVESVLNL